MTTIEFSSGIDMTELHDAFDRGVDQGGNPIEPFVDEDGGWPLRCCLTDSAPGVGADESTAAAVASVLGAEDVEFVHGRNVTGGCYAFTARRVGDLR